MDTKIFLAAKSFPNERENEIRNGEWNGIYLLDELLPVQEFHDVNVTKIGWLSYIEKKHSIHSLPFLYLLYGFQSVKNHQRPTIRNVPQSNSLTFRYILNELKLFGNG
jgi:hypothetical protein